MAAVRDPLVSFVWGKGGAALTPEEIAQQRELEKAVRAKGIDTSPVGHWTQGAARVAEAIAGAFQRGSLDKAEAENTTYNEGIINNLLGGGSSAAPAAAASIPASGASAEIAATDPSPVDISGDRSTFVQSLLPAAIEESKRTGVDPRIIVAQAAQETGWGKSAPGNNFFGIKSHGQEGGQTLATNEVIDGKTVRINDSFRQFASPADSVRGYGDFLLANPRYQPMREAQGLDAQLEALGASGYATDPNYSRSVGAIARGIQLPQEVAAASPQAAIEAISPTGAALADPSQISTEDTQRLQALRGPIGGNTPYSGPGARIDTPMPVYDTSGLHMPQEYAAQAPAMEPPQEVGPAPSVASPMQAEPQAVDGAVRVAQALPAAGQAQQAAPDMSEALIRAITDPRATPQTRAVAQALMQQQMAQQQAAQEMRMKQSDPAYQIGLEKSRLEVENLRNPRLTAADQLAREKFDLEKGQHGKTADINEYEYAKDLGYQGSFVDFQLDQKKAGAPSNTFNMGEGDKFYEELDKKKAGSYAALSDSGMQARSKIAQIDRLEGIMANAPQGAIGALKQTAGEWGIPTEGLSDIQAATALLEKMVPEQRAPGSGPMSDADIKMFRASLPRIINQTGGNQLIFQTMRGIAQYEMQMGDIADKIVDREITPAEGRRMIRELKNPLADFKIPTGSTPNEGWKDVRPGVRIREAD